jgi:hypothetical protein
MLTMLRPIRLDTRLRKPQTGIFYPFQHLPGDIVGPFSARFLPTQLKPTSCLAIEE